MDPEENFLCQLSEPQKVQPEPWQMLAWPLSLICAVVFPPVIMPSQGIAMLVDALGNE